MQVVIALPPLEGIDRLYTPVCGVPLLARVILTAARAGATRVLLLYPPGVPDNHLHTFSEWRRDSQVRVESARIAAPFDVCKDEDWLRISHLLEEQFLWMPCDYVPHVDALAQLVAAAAEDRRSSREFASAADDESFAEVFKQPVVISKTDLLEGLRRPFEFVVSTTEPGASADPSASMTQVETELVRRSGKVTDSVYSNLNRRLCRPAVRRLSHTRVSPNTIGFCGLAVTVLAGILFAQGSWAFDVAGGILFFISGLLDEVDGMLATLKFRESTIGCRPGEPHRLHELPSAVGGDDCRRISQWRRSIPVLRRRPDIGLRCFFCCVFSRQRPSSAWSGSGIDYCRRHVGKLSRNIGNPISAGIRNVRFLTSRGLVM